MLEQDAGQQFDDIPHAQQSKQLPEGVVAEGEVHLGGLAPGDLSQRSREPHRLAGGREGHLIEDIVQVALQGQLGCLLPGRCHSIQLLQIGPQRPKDGLGRHKADALAGVELVFGTVEEGVLLDVGSRAARLSVLGLQGLQHVLQLGVLDQLVEQEHAAVGPGAVLASDEEGVEVPVEGGQVLLEGEAVRHAQLRGGWRKQGRS